MLNPRRLCAQFDLHVSLRPSSPLIGNLKYRKALGMWSLQEIQRELQSVSAMSKLEVACFSKTSVGAVSKVPVPTARQKVSVSLTY